MNKTVFRTDIIQETFPVFLQKFVFYIRDNRDFFIVSIESCVSTSKARILSTSFPKNSIRYGFSFEKEKTSIIPPRTENSPGSVTKSTRFKFVFKQNFVHEIDRNFIVNGNF